MATAIGIGLLVAMGILVAGYNLRTHLQFDAFCRDVANEKGEEEALDDPRGGFDGGYTGYRHRIHSDLLKGVIDPSLGDELRCRAELLTRALPLARYVTWACVGLVIILGLAFRW